MFIGIYLRSQVSVYRTIGPLVFNSTEEYVYHDDLQDFTLNNSERNVYNLMSLIGRTITISQLQPHFKPRLHIHGFIYDLPRFTPISHGQKNRGGPG